VFLYAANDEDGILNDPEVLQPFNLVVTGEKDKQGDDIPVLCVFIEGELNEKYSKTSDAGETIYTPAYNFLTDFLKPLVNELAEMADNKLDLILAYLEKSVQKNKISAELGPAATILFVPSEGQAVAVSNRKETPFSWGWSSNALGYSETKVEEKVVGDPPASKPLSLAEKLALKRGTASAPAAAKPEEKKIDESEKKIADKLSKGPHFGLKGSVLWCVPKGMNLKEMKNWWTANSVLPVPKDKEGRPDPKMMAAGFDPTHIRPASPLAGLLANARKPKTAVSEQAPIPPEHKEAKDAEDAEKQPKKAEMTMLLSAEKRQAYVANSKKGEYPSWTEEQIKDTLQYPLLSLQIGEAFHDLLYKDAMAYLKMDKHALALFAHELRVRHLGIASEEVKPPEAKPAPVEEKKPMTLAEKLAAKRTNVA
jgi:hypothetical protein